MNQHEALLVALNALQAIDDEHPYPIAKHAIVQISRVLAQPEPWVGLTDEEIAKVVGSPLDEVYLIDFRRVIAALRSKNT
jgi:hypothetical protein